MMFHRTCSRGVKANNEWLSGENVSVIDPICFLFGILIMLFDLQHIVPGEDERGENLHLGSHGKLIITAVSPV